MSIERDRVARFVKKTAKLTAAPAVFSMALLSTGCLGDRIERTDFPPCKQDPQTKVQKMMIREPELEWLIEEYKARIDGVTFELEGSSPRRVDIESEDSRVNEIAPGQIEFIGNEDGRTYKVTFPTEIKTSAAYVQVEASCKKDN